MGREDQPGGTAQDNRLFINAVIWIFKTGAPWRDLPERFGNWNNVHRRFARWSKEGIFDKIFYELSSDPDMEKYKDYENEAIGRSRGGLTTKIHCVVDGLGNPVYILH